MSTVSKSTADAIKAGKYPEDGCFLIVRYENAFNGDYAYKCYFRLDQLVEIDAMSQRQIAQYLYNQILRIYGGSPMIYYVGSNVSKLVRDALIETFGQVLEGTEEKTEEKTEKQS